MRKLISTRTHGMIDNSWTAAATALSIQRVSGTSTARLLARAAAVARTSSMMTNYESGTVRVLPMKAHLAADIALCSLLIASPLLLPASERRLAAIPLVLGIIGLVTSLLTETHSSTERDPRGFSDPDVVAHPHLRAHLE